METNILDVATVRQLCRSGEARRLREAHGLSLADVGLGVTAPPQAIWRWERGKNMPRRDACLRYGRVLAGLLDLSEWVGEES